MAKSHVPPARVAGTDGVAANPPEGLDGLYSGKSETVPGSKEFVKKPDHVETEQEISKKVEDSKKEEGVAKELYPTAAKLRAARMARLGLLDEIDIATAPSVPKEAQALIWAVAERKASDLAKLQTIQYRKALELAYKAQERGITEFPLYNRLVAALQAQNVPDASLIALDALSGGCSENLAAAAKQADDYLRLDDAAFLATASVIEKTPPLNARDGINRSASTRIAEEAERGSIPLQATTISKSAGPSDLRSRLRTNAPIPLSK
jgi:hypothetical protein